MWEKEILYKFPYSKWFRDGIHSLLRQADVRNHLPYVTHITTL